MVQLFTKNDEVSIFVQMCITDLSAISQDRSISKKEVALTVTVPTTFVYSVLMKAVREEKRLRDIGRCACTYFNMPVFLKATHLTIMSLFLLCRIIIHRNQEIRKYRF